MKTVARENDDKMLLQLFLKLLPVQVGLVAMGSINSIIDGIVAARFIGLTAVGAVGLYFTMMRVLEAVGNLLLGGTSVLCGRHLGAGKIKETQGVSTLSITTAFVFGLILTIVSLVMPDFVSSLLGADAGLKETLSTYVKGYSIGIIPMLLGQQFALCLQLERQDKRGQIGIAVMIVFNAALDILFVPVMGLGIWGLALSTSVSNWAYFLVVASYYLSKNAQLKPDLKLVIWSNLPFIVRIGFPNALLVISLAGRSLILNRLLLTYAGEAGLSALSAFNMISGLILALALGIGSVVRMLSSVFVGEENREGLISLMRIGYTYMMAMITVMAVALFMLAPFLSGIFFPDHSSVAFGLTKQLFSIYAFCVPAVLACILYSNYCQALGYSFYVNMFSVVDGFFSMVIPSVLLTPVIGALGVWLAFPIGLVISIFITVLYIVIRIRRWPRSLDEWLMLAPEFGGNERLVLHVRSMEQVPQTSQKVELFCVEHGIKRKIGMHAGLCLEEMAGNIVRHGFEADKKNHSIEIRVILQENDVTLRIKDDCIPFNPKEWYEMANFINPPDNIGIRLVYAVASDLMYQNLLGLNVLTIRMSQ